MSVHISGDFFPKRAFHGGTFCQKIFSWGNFWRKFMGSGCCTWTKLRKRFQRLCHVQFPSC